jgi:signal transduction histidine kinase
MDSHVEGGSLEGVARFSRFPFSAVAPCWFHRLLHNGSTQSEARRTIEQEHNTFRMSRRATYGRVCFREEPTKREDERDGKEDDHTKMTASHKVWRSAAPGLLGTIGLALVTLICFRLQVGLATAALLYLMIVALVSLKRSFISSVMVSIFAVGCLDYFFTTPLFTLGMNDLPSYVALPIFLTVSLIITQLVSRVRKQAEEALSSVSHRVIEAEEKERRRIASNLHEDIGQRLALLSIVIEQLEADSGNSAIDLQSRLDAVRKETLRILTDVKALAHELHSPRLEYLGIAAVMSSFCKEYGERKGVEIDFRSDGLPSTAPPDISLCLFRVLQETLHNAVQHSGVRKFDVQLEGMSDAIRLTVSDSGVGFNLEAARKNGGLGLNRMQERLKLVKGSLFVESRPERGTAIHARVPRHSGTRNLEGTQFGI